MVTRNTVKLIKTYVEAIKANGISVSKVILYGSYARNEAKPTSDLDLMLISPLFDVDDEKYMGILWSLTKLSDYRIEPLAIGEKRFNSGEYSPIIEIAKKEGIEIKI